MGLNESILDLCMGRKIGSGYSRDVYEWLPDTTKVLKVAREDNLFRGVAANIAEFELWERVREGEFYNNAKQWLAPVHLISNDGKAMLQSRTEPVRTCELPAKIPVWITDVKQNNVGWLDGKIVFHDYAMNLIPENGLSNKTVKAYW